jgi:hypothetical protein
MCKVFVRLQWARGPATEALWAYRFGKNTARINNVPVLTDKVAYEDVVRVRPSGEVVKVLKKGTRTRRGRYESPSGPAEATSLWRAIRDHLERFGIVAESAVPGLFAMAVPLDMTDDKLEDICAACPVPFGLYAPGLASSSR